MPKIKFSHQYKKLLDTDNNIISTATLLGVFTVDLADLNPELIDYDTDSGLYQLPDSGIFLMLMFRKPEISHECAENLFITLRRHTMPKQKYYRDNIGKVFDVVLT